MCQSRGHYNYVSSNDESKVDEHFVDLFAIDIMSNHFNSINGPFLKIGILMGALSFFFLYEGLSNGNEHPFQDDRLRVIIERFELEKLSNLCVLAILALSLWMNDFKHIIEIPQTGETYKDQFYNTLDEFSRFNQTLYEGITQNGIRFRLAKD
ncbi:hypothetical protein [Sphingobacterium bovistauri]|uniref:Uncharacterized protein n=1 Tax=Sphingobacterium bovistauri TaxID=2781959 RepID=A0ABS7Z464_9SPHI|nr:hypothetical protein [Sphingobacterium bovistauri]MCA5004803.1 hypothetical protein [Sphingobacterium bovistauri]